MDAFFELSTCRQTELGPIPWTAIQEYARTYGMDAHRLTRLLRALDAVYIEKMRAKAKKPMPNKGGEKPKQLGR